MYELDAYATLVSPGYLNRLNDPTPWSTKLMPQHRNMIRSQCHVLESVGGALSRYVLTIRLSPRPGSEADLRAYLKSHSQSAAAQPGLSGAHLLVTDTPRIAATAEQNIRGGMDRAADWIYIVNGYAINAVTACDSDILNAAQLRDFGGERPAWSDVYCLSHTFEAAGAG